MTKDREVAIVKAIEALMTEKGVNAATVADATGIERSSLSRILNGKVKSPRRTTLAALAKYFGVSYDDLRTNAALFVQPKTTLSKADQIQAIYDRLSRIQDDLIELSEELYDLFNGEPDENGPVAERLDAAHEALEEIWSGTDDSFGDALFYLARAMRAAKKEEA